MAMRANQAFVTAANTIDGRKMVFAADSVVPDQIAKALPNLVYDDGAPAQPTDDGTPPDVHTCDQCGGGPFKSARGLAIHQSSHDE